MNRDACLTLVLPHTLEEELIDHLLQHPEWIGPFVTVAVDGHGAPEHIASVGEQVRGRARRVRVDVLVNAADGQRLIDHLHEDMTGANIDWWLAPVLKNGSFTA